MLSKPLTRDECRLLTFLKVKSKDYQTVIHKHSVKIIFAHSTECCRMSKLSLAYLYYYNTVTVVPCHMIVTQAEATLL